jgi:hypothetical protein
MLMENIIMTSKKNMTSKNDFLFHDNVAIEYDVTSCF